MIGFDPIFKSLYPALTRTDGKDHSLPPTSIYPSLLTYIAQAKSDPKIAMGNSNATPSSSIDDHVEPQLQIKPAKEFRAKVIDDRKRKLQADQIESEKQEEIQREKFQATLRKSVEEATRRMESESMDTVPLKGIKNKYSRYIRCDTWATQVPTPSDLTYHWDVMVAKLDALGYRLQCHKRSVQPIDAISPYHPDVTLSLK